MDLLGWFINTKLGMLTFHIVVGGILSAIFSCIMLFVVGSYWDCFFFSWIVGAIVGNLLTINRIGWEEYKDTPWY